MYLQKRNMSMSPTSPPFWASPHHSHGVQATRATSIPQRIARRIAGPCAEACRIHGAGTPLEVVTVAIHLVDAKLVEPLE